MRVALIGLIILLTIPHVEAAPAPEPGRAAKEKLGALKKRLPGVLNDWAKNARWERDDITRTPKLRVLRRVGPARAKAVIHFEAFQQNGARTRYFDVLVTVFLTYQDDCWTTERFEKEVNFRVLENGTTELPNFAFLMVDIDEAAEK